MIQRSKIFMVDDNITNLKVGKKALENIYDVLTIPSGKKLFTILDTITPDLILLDVNMPEMDGYEVINNLKSDESTQDIPVIFLTARNDMDSELEGLNLGAIDYIYKPFTVPLLRKRIENHLLLISQKADLKRYNEDLQGLIEEKTKTVTELKNSVLNVVAELVECRDGSTGAHISRTQEYLQVMLKKMMEQMVYNSEVSKWDFNFLVPSAQLHDVGKIMIKDNILLKPGRLTNEEFEIMKTHTALGGEIIDMIAQNTTEETFLKHAKIFAVSHHEKWDGTGYPKGLSGENIPLEGRLMAISDVYDALVSERPYKIAMTHEEACSIIMEGKGRHFDPVLVDVFLSVKDDFAEIVKSFSHTINPAV